jgi:RNA polymerase sigma factor (sigma-70 family)
MLGRCGHIVGDDVSGVSTQAIEQVYRRRGADFFRFALARTGDRELARDAVQEGFARALRSRSTFRGSGPLEAWVARCVLNAAHDLAPTPLPSASPEQEAAAWDGAPDEEVRAALRQLPPRQRDAIFLRFYLDLDYAAIAGTLGVEVGTVSATLHAGQEALKRVLREVPK